MTRRNIIISVLIAWAVLVALAFLLVYTGGWRGNVHHNGVAHVVR